MTQEKNRGREEIRIVQVYDDLEGINTDDWQGLRSLVRVTRSTVTKETAAVDSAYFISSLPPDTSAAVFAAGIRGHWGIESLHYTKDVTFREDDWQVRTKNAPANYSLLRNVCLNAFRKNGLTNMQAAMEKCANNVSFMLSLL